MSNFVNFCQILKQLICKPVVVTQWTLLFHNYYDYTTFLQCVSTIVIYILSTNNNNNNNNKSMIRDYQNYII